MVNLPENQKLQVLLAELQERYNASHKIRERSMQFTLWISGMAIGLEWLLISKSTLTVSQSIALTLLILALFTGTIYFIMGLRRGFLNNRKALINVERALGMYEADIYLPEVPLLPREYSHIKRKWSDHFYTLYIWLIVVALSLLILTWTTAYPLKGHSSDTKIEHIKGGNHNG